MSESKRGRPKSTKFIGMITPCTLCSDPIILTEAMLRNRLYRCKKCHYATKIKNPISQRKADGLWKKRNRNSVNEYTRDYRKRFPEKRIAHRAVKTAIKNGLLIRMPCEKCGEPKSEGHHDDYSKPLEVRWLCTIHHHEHHKLLAKQQSPA